MNLCNLHSHYSQIARKGTRFIGFCKSAFITFL